MHNLHTVLLIGVMSLVTMILRFFPFFAFHQQKESMDTLTYLGNVLPYAIMGMLVIFCLKNISFVPMPFGILEIVASVVVIL